MSNKSIHTDDIDTSKVLSRKSQQIVKAKIKGHSNKDIGKIQYPKASPASQASLVSRELNKPHVAQFMEQSKLIALKEAGISWGWIINRIKEAGDASKQNQFTGEINPDHSIRLAAVKQARELMEVKQIDTEVKEQLANISSDLDEIQLIRLMKK